MATMDTTADSVIPPVVESTGFLNPVFEKVPVSEFPLPESGQVLTIPSTASILEACSQLDALNILCAPVTGPEGQVIGIVDAVGLLFFVLDTLDKVKFEPTNYLQQVSAAEIFRETAVIALRDRPRWQEVVTVDNSFHTMLDVMVLLGKHNVHRVLVKSETAFTNLITQGAVMKLIAANLRQFGGIEKLTLKELGLAEKLPVASVSIKQTPIDAFRVMAEQQVHGVPVLDPSGKLVGNVSAREARRVISDPSWFALLTRPLNVWLDEDMFCVIGCSPTTTLEDVVERVAGERLHHIYIVDDDNNVIRVLSLRDIIARIVRDPTSDM